MILADLTAGEDHEDYQRLEVENLQRQYDFLRSLINAAVRLDHRMLSTGVVTALNYHAISCLHPYAGVYRPCRVDVRRNGEVVYDPPAQHLVPGLMNHFINYVNRVWSETPADVLAAYCLWRLNYIHPFINGNGRTARALCYYVVCVKHGSALPGSPILPELLRRNRQEYVQALRSIDQSVREARTGTVADWLPLVTLVRRLLQEQLGTADA